MQKRGWHSCTCIFMRSFSYLSLTLRYFPSSIEFHCSLACQRASSVYGKDLPGHKTWDDSCPRSSEEDTNDNPPGILSSKCLWQRRAHSLLVCCRTRLEQLSQRHGTIGTWNCKQYIFGFMGRRWCKSRKSLNVKLDCFWSCMRTVYFSVELVYFFYIRLEHVFMCIVLVLGVTKFARFFEQLK